MSRGGGIFGAAASRGRRWGNVNYQIKAWDKVVALTATLTADRTWTLPAAASVPPGHSISVIDEVGGVSASNFISVQRTGSDTINGFTVLAVAEPFVHIAFVSNGVDRWSATPASVGIFEFLTVNNGGAEITGEANFLTDAIVQGTLTTNDIEAGGTIRQSGSTGPMGYDTGAGGSVTQLTSKSTAVTVNTPCGLITTDNAALAAGASVIFTVNNSTVAAGSMIVLAMRNGTNYRAEVVGTGSGNFDIRLTNVSVGSLSNAILINFAVLSVAAS